MASAYHTLGKARALESNILDLNSTLPLPDGMLLDRWVYLFCASISSLANKDVREDDLLGVFQLYSVILL